MSIQLLHLYPDLMNLYGEYANVAALRRSLERQGAEVVVRTGTLYEDIDFSGADFLYMGAGTESAQLTALEDLRRYETAVRAALERGAVVLATRQRHGAVRPQHHRPRRHRAHRTGPVPLPHHRVRHGAYAG